MNSDRVIHQVRILVNAIDGLDEVVPTSLLERAIVWVLRFVWVRRLEWLAFDASVPNWAMHYIVNVSRRARAAPGKIVTARVIGGWW